MPRRSAELAAAALAVLGELITRGARGTSSATTWRGAGAPRCARARARAQLAGRRGAGDRCSAGQPARRDRAGARAACRARWCTPTPCELTPELRGAQQLGAELLAVFAGVQLGDLRSRSRAAQRALEPHPGWSAPTWKVTERAGARELPRGAPRIKRREGGCRTLTGMRDAQLDARARLMGADRPRSTSGRGPRTCALVHCGLPHEAGGARADRRHRSWTRFTTERLRSRGRVTSPDVLGRDRFDGA